MKLRKTIQVDLLEPTKRKEELIKEGMKQTQEVMNRTAKRMPSLSKKILGNQKAKTYYEMVKEFRNNRIDLSSDCTQEAVQKVRENYLQMHETKKERWKDYYRKREKGKRPSKPKKFPEYKKPEPIIFHRRGFEIEKHKERWYIDCCIFPYKRIKLPVKKGKYQDKYLKSLKSGAVDYGASELVKYNDGYKFNLTLREEVSDLEIDKIKHIASIDLGLNNIVTLSIMDMSGKVKEVKPFSGGEAGFMRQKCYKRKKDLQKKGKLKEVKRTRGFEKRWMENHNHNISKKIINIVKKYEKPIIVFEDLKNIRKTIRKRNKLRGKAKKRSNRQLSSWDWARLKNFIIYKAERERIPVTEVKPANTSLRCSKCGYIHEDNREGIHFKCVNCGNQINADVNGAVNIGFRLLKKLMNEEESSPKLINQSG